MGNSCGTATPTRQSNVSEFKAKSTSQSTHSNKSTQSSQKKKAENTKTSSITTETKEIVVKKEIQHRNSKRSYIIDKSEVKEEVIVESEHAVSTAPSIRQQWKVFFGLDTNDEAEIFRMAKFFQTLMDNIPGVEEEGDMDSGKASFSSNREESIRKLSAVEDVESSRLISVSNIDITFDESHKIQVYDIGKGSEVKITLDAINKIIQTCRFGGTLHENTIVKVLRDVYKLFKVFPNIQHISINDNAKVHVFGDLHGNLSDLLHVLDETGLPNENNIFIFNGDFVDRGQYSIEVITIIFALIALYPKFVFANRGNHEDEVICRVYGFFNDVTTRHSLLLFEMFCEVFRHIPLFSIINNSIFIVHGGLFRYQDVTLEDLSNINRCDYNVTGKGDVLEETEEEDESEFYKHLQRDALWSDPSSSIYGIKGSDRGAGIKFGRDVALDFMKLNNLSMVIRSHECIFDGFQQCFNPANTPYSEDEYDLNYSKLNYQLVPNISFITSNMNPNSKVKDEVDIETNPELAILSGAVPLVVTLFSASNYGKSDNFGSYITFTTRKHKDSLLPTNSSYDRSVYTDLGYVVHRYKTAESDLETIEKNNLSSLRDLLIRKKGALIEAFVSQDTNKSGLVSKAKWAQVLQNVTQLQFSWIMLVHSLVDKSCFHPDNGMIFYKLFLESLEINVKVGDGNSATSLAAMYVQRSKLEKIFQFFDSNGDGIITRKEFRSGCDLLNKVLDSSDSRIEDVDHLLDLMDFDKSDSIDINEFLEVSNIFLL